MSILHVLIGYVSLITSRVSFTAVIFVYGPKYFALSLATFLTFITLGKSSLVVTFIYGYVLSSLRSTLYFGLYLFIKLHSSISASVSESVIIYSKLLIFFTIDFTFDEWFLDDWKYCLTLFLSTTAFPTYITFPKASFII